MADYGDLTWNLFGLADGLSPRSHASNSYVSFYTFYKSCYLYNILYKLTSQASLQYKLEFGNLDEGDTLEYRYR